MCVGGHGRVDEVETYAQIVGGFHNLKTDGRRRMQGDGLTVSHWSLTPRKERQEEEKIDQGE